MGIHDEPERLRTQGSDADRPATLASAESTHSSHWAVAASGGTALGGASQVDPQRDELIKTMVEKCPGVAITLDQSKADFVLDMQREPNKGYLRKRNKWILSSRAGAVVGVGSDRSVGDVAKDACTTVQKTTNPPGH
ncbi:MAG: hypothetical protein ACRD1L_12720 [Terriglobales bacterium]